MSSDVLTEAEDTLAEMCWCGHPWWNHTDSDTPVCVHPHRPDDDDGSEEWTDYACECDGWWPMNEDPPDPEWGGDQVTMPIGPV